jgi:hypothetical protein
MNRGIDAEAPLSSLSPDLIGQKVEEILPKQRVRFAGVQSLQYPLILAVKSAPKGHNWLIPDILERPEKPYACPRDREA